MRLDSASCPFFLFHFCPFHIFALFVVNDKMWPPVLENPEKTGRSVLSYWTGGDVSIHSVTF